MNGVEGDTSKESIPPHGFKRVYERMGIKMTTRKMHKREKGTQCFKKLKGGKQRMQEKKDTINNK